VGAIAEAHLTRLYAQVPPKDVPERPTGDNEAIPVSLEMEASGPLAFIWRERALQVVYALWHQVQRYPPYVDVAGCQCRAFRRMAPRLIREPGSRRFTDQWTLPSIATLITVERGDPA